MNWSLTGLDRLMIEGRFTKPQASRNIEREMMRSSSPVTAFVQDVCVIERGAFTTKADMWLEWKRWAESTGQYVGTQEAFGKYLALTKGKDKAADSRVRDEIKALGGDPGDAGNDDQPTKKKKKGK